MTKKKRGDKVMWQERELKEKKKKRKNGLPWTYTCSIFCTPNTVRKISMRWL
jgi:hypothetical protein